MLYKIKEDSSSWNTDDSSYSVVDHMAISNSQIIGTTRSSNESSRGTRLHMFLIVLDSDGYLLEDQSNLKYIHATTSHNAALDD